MTFLGEGWPIFWERAAGVNVWDADGSRYLDFTSAFGVCGLGHGRAEIVAAGQKQMGALMHGMGDVHPTQLKGELCRELSKITFERWGLGIGKTTLGGAGFEAIETALKTARLRTGRTKVIAFDRGYHGLGYGALLGTDLEKFRGPFKDQLAPVTVRLPYGQDPDEELKGEEIAAVLVEPVQGRGGKRFPPPEFLKTWRNWCDSHGVVLIFDEIYTGFWRTGELLASDWAGAKPDIICLGKALSGGFPISACVGKAEVMDAWPQSPGEALHTSTYLGNPVGCAMALAALKLHQEPTTEQEVRRLEAILSKSLQTFDLPGQKEFRGRGAMWGVEFSTNQGALLGELLETGLIFLADGPEGNVLSFSPPFAMTEEEVEFACETIKSCF